MVNSINPYSYCIISKTLLYISIFRRIYLGLNYIEMRSYVGQKAFEELENLLVEEELDEIYRSSKEFRKRFMFR